MNLHTGSPMRFGLKYGALKMKKAGCMSCGNMEHTGCVCHMLGAGKKKKSMYGGAEDELPDYMKNLMLAYEQQNNKPDQYTGYTMEELATMPVSERRRIKRDAEKKRYDAQRRGGAVDKMKASLLRDKFKSLNKQHTEIKRKSDEEDRIRMQAEKEEEEGDWLDDAFEFATDKLIEYGSKGIAAAIPIPGVEKLAKTGLTALQKKLKEGGQRVQSQKQIEYQQALGIIKKKYGLNHKEAMIKYKEIKNNM